MNNVGDMTLHSDAFEPNTTIPKRYTCDGENSNPPLQIHNVPENTKSLVLIVDDPDIPEAVKKARLIEKFDHWVVCNISPNTTEIPEEAEGFGVFGKNSAGENAYTGPCPPTEFEPTEHRYVFQVYALDIMLGLDSSAVETDVRNAMKGHIITKAELVGLYDRTKN